MPYLTISKYAVVSDSYEFKLIKDENEDLKADLHQQKLIDEHDLQQLVEGLVQERLAQQEKQINDMIEKLVKEKSPEW